MQITPPWLWWAWRELPASAQTLRYEIWSLKALGCLCSVEFEISLAEQVRPMESRISDQSLTSLSFYYKVHSLSILLKNNTILTDHLRVTPPPPIHLFSPSIMKTPDCRLCVHEASHFTSESHWLRSFVLFDGQHLALWERSVQCISIVFVSNFPHFLRILFIFFLWLNLRKTNSDLFLIFSSIWNTN